MPILAAGYNGVIPRGCLIKLQAIYDSLKKAEKKAADLLLTEPDFFANASIVEAAAKAGCSEATLFRLTKKMGYPGYPELKADLAEGREPPGTALYNLMEGDEPERVVAKVFQASIQALQDTLNVLDRHEYQKAVEAICNARKMVFYGVGDAAAVALSGYQKFLRAGMDVQMPADFDLQLMSVSRMARGDVLIAISHTGKTKTVLDVVKYARLHGVTVVSITNFPVSPLTKNSDIILLTAAFDEHAKGEVISKRVTELCILESLFANVLLKNKDRCGASLEEATKAVEVNKL